MNYKKLLLGSVGAVPKVGQWNLANVHYDPKSLAFKWTAYDTTRTCLLYTSDAADE